MEMVADADDTCPNTIESVEVSENGCNDR